MVSNKNGVVVLDRHICGENLATRWGRDATYLMRYVACGRLKPYGLIGRDHDGQFFFTQSVDVSKPEYLTDTDPWHGRRVVCFSLDEVEGIEKTDDVQAPLPSPAPTWSPGSLSTGPDSAKALAEARQRIAELERELAEARQEIERVKADGQKPPKTAGACEAAKASRVEEWKGYATVMAKTAYKCGLVGKKDVTRNQLQTLAEAHGGISSTALDLLRDALPEVAKKTAGAPKQG